MAERNPSTWRNTMTSSNAFQSALEWWVVAIVVLVAYLFSLFFSVMADRMKRAKGLRDKLTY